MIKSTATTYLCATNGVEEPAIVDGPFDGHISDCTIGIERAARTYVATTGQDEMLLFALTLHPDQAPEFEYVGLAEMFRRDE